MTSQSNFISYNFSREFLIKVNMIIFYINLFSQKLLTKIKYAMSWQLEVQNRHAKRNPPHLGFS